MVPRSAPHDDVHRTSNLMLSATKSWIFWPSPGRRRPLPKKPGMHHQIEVVLSDQTQERRCPRENSTVLAVYLFRPLSGVTLANVAGRACVALTAAVPHCTGMG